MHAKCGRPGRARHLFDGLPHKAFSAFPLLNRSRSSIDPPVYNSRNVIHWNRRMSEHVRLGEHHSALRCFEAMRRSGLMCDNVSFVVALSAASGVKCVESGEQMHCLALKTSLHNDVSVSNNAINMYSRVGRLGVARRVFDEMKVLDVVSWNSMISSYTQCGFEMESIALFSNMRKNSIVPDHYTIASVLRACAPQEGGDVLCQEVHCLAVKLGLCMDAFIVTGLVDVYAKKGCAKEAEALLDGSDNYSIACCNALISGYLTTGENDKALDFFTKIWGKGEVCDDYTLATVLKACGSLVAFEKGRQVHGNAIKLGHEFDICVASALLDFYIKCGDMENASLIFVDIQEPDEVAWTTMISGCVEHGDEGYALELYLQTRRLGIQLDEYILASLAKACSCLAVLNLGRQIHAHAVKMAFTSDTYVGTSFMDMYAKGGAIEDSYLLFNRLSKRSLASWNAMIVGLAQHGYGKEALILFKNMRAQGVRPDKITFVGVLSACSHSGIVSEAYGFFDSMYKDYGIQPEIEHYSCFVDVLGRSGLLAEAEEVLETMPYQATEAMCRTLLGACRVGKNTEIAGRMAARLLAKDPHDSSAYVLLSNIHATANEWDEVGKARETMKRKKVKKDPGYSWVEVKNKIHLFVVDDKSHPESVAIYDKLDGLIRRIKIEGYVPNTDSALLNLEDEEKDCSLYHHSEKLAVAFALLAIPAPLSIRIIKNLRVCGDCHNAIKYISKIVERDIIIRDANRFHHFRHGKCSCNDYW